MLHKLIQKREKLNEIFTKATNKDYYNLFQPVIPKIDLTGKIAQVISAATEAVTVWLICQSELSAINKYLAFFLSLIAVVLVVAAIEVGGRKGLQVITRAIVWKKLVNFWYWLLFIAVGTITGFLFWQSYGLSTKGVNQSFKQSVKTAIVFDDSDLITRHQYFNDQINAKYDKQATTLADAFQLEYSAKEKEFNAKIESVKALIAEHTSNKQKGVKWSQSHISKQTKIKNGIESEKEGVLAQLTANHTTKLKAVESARMQELKKESGRHFAALTKAETAENANHDNDKANAQFWGDLLSGLVGVMIVIAFVCIVIVEVFRKGSGIEIDYWQQELPPSLIGIALQGINNRLFNVSYKWVNKLYVEKNDFVFKELVPLQLEEQPEPQAEQQKNEVDWNIVLAETLSENDNLENGFSLNQFNNSSSLKEYTIESKDSTPIVDIRTGQKSTEGRVIIKGFLSQKDHQEISEDNPIKRIKIGHRVDILDLNKLNKRDKEKWKAKQKKRIIKYYNNHLQKKGKKPSYKVISDALDLSVTTIGKYVRELKNNGEL